MSSKVTISRQKLSADSRYKSEVIILGLVSSVVLACIAAPTVWNMPTVWFNIFWIIVSWTASDYFVDISLIKRRGVVHIPVVGWTVTRRSWALVAYLIGIVVGSFAGNLVTQIFVDLIQAQNLQASGVGMLYWAGSAFMFLCVFYDLKFRTDDRGKRKEKPEKPKQEPRLENSASE